MRFHLIGVHMLFVTWGDRDLLNSPYQVMIKDGAELMNSMQRGTMSHAQQQQSYSTMQSTASNGNYSVTSKGDTFCADDSEPAYSRFQLAGLRLTGCQLAPLVFDGFMSSACLFWCWG